MKHCKVCSALLPASQFYGTRKICKSCYKGKITNKRSQKKLLDLTGVEGEYLGYVMSTEDISNFERDVTTRSRPSDETETYVPPFATYVVDHKNKLVTDSHPFAFLEFVPTKTTKPVTRVEFLRIARNREYKRVPTWFFLAVVNGRTMPNAEELKVLQMAVSREECSYMVYTKLEMPFALEGNDSFRVIATGDLAAVDIAVAAAENIGYIRVNKYMRSYQ